MIWMLLFLGQPQEWRAWFDSPGGPLPFKLVIEGDSAYVQNASEKLAFDQVIRVGENIELVFDHYDSRIKATLSGNKMNGTWRKTVNAERVAELPFQAELGPKPRFEKPLQTGPAQVLAPRYEVMFNHVEDGETPAILEIEEQGSELIATFMTKTGDYRFLQGNRYGNRLFLSCFDAGHAFLFTATQGEDGNLHGDFWSSDKWHETWLAKPNPNATLPDAFALTTLQGQTFKFTFPNLHGEMVSQDNFTGKPLIVSIFGSWCPNCNDEHRYLVELAKKFPELQIVGIAFEATGQESRDLPALKKFKKRFKIPYPLLYAGGKDKKEAAKTLGQLNHVLAYPTTLFMDRNGKVVKIHTGFTGPGTGEHYNELKKEFETTIQAL